MPRILLGILILVWGTAVVVQGLSGHSGGSAYATGQFFAWLIGFALIAAGVMAVRNGFRERHHR
jgi:hypothetical protein